MVEYQEIDYLGEKIYRFTWFNHSETTAREFYDLVVQLYDKLAQDNQIIRIVHDYRHVSLVPRC